MDCYSLHIRLSPSINASVPMCGPGDQEPLPSSSASLHIRLVNARRASAKKNEHREFAKGTT
jgi:hypothetical protein